MDLEFMLLDTMDNIRPKQAPKVADLAEASEACNRIRRAEAAILDPVPTSTDLGE